MKVFDIYKITYLNGDTKLYKNLTSFYNDYRLITNDSRNYENFRYSINNNLYNSDITYKHRGEEHSYKLKLNKVEKYNHKDFLQDYINEYKVIRKVNDTEYTKSNIFYNKIYNLAKYRVECVS